MRRLPCVVVIGRPNVGKSTFFNRVVGRVEAVVDDLPGVTRDRREAQASWNGVPFSLVDTGGLVPGSEDVMESAILTQARVALDGADLVLFLVDVRDGITAMDQDIAEQLRPHADKVVLVANKVEGPRQELAAAEASTLGFGSPWVISGQHGRGVGDLLDEVVRHLPQQEPDAAADEIIHVTLVGRPNVGKSSLANRLLGEPRLIVNPEAGTTRDAVDVPFRFDGTDFLLVDTAGLRRRTHVAKGVEYYSTVRTQRSIDRSDVVLLVLDASEPVSAQDARIASMVEEAGKSVVILYNKWDLVAKETRTSDQRERELRRKFDRLRDVPILFVSAETGLRVSRIPHVVREAFRERKQHYPTSRLNEYLEEAIERRQPPMRNNGKPIKLYYMTQVADSPPILAIFANHPDEVPASYQNFLRNRFRERLGLTATPLRLVFRARR